MKNHWKERSVRYHLLSWPRWITNRWLGVGEVKNTMNCLLKLQKETFTRASRWSWTFLRLDLILHLHCFIKNFPSSVILKMNEFTPEFFHFLYSVLTTLYKQRSRYDSLNLGGMLSALLLLNEFIQNNLSAIYHLVDSWRTERKTPLRTLVLDYHPRDTSWNARYFYCLCDFWQVRKFLCTLVIHLLNWNLFRVWSCEDEDDLFLPHSDT